MPSKVKDSAIKGQDRTILKAKQCLPCTENCEAQKSEACNVSKPEISSNFTNNTQVNGEPQLLQTYAASAVTDGASAVPGAARITREHTYGVNLLEHPFWGEFLQSGNISSLYDMHYGTIYSQLSALRPGQGLLVAALIYSLADFNFLRPLDAARDYLLSRESPELILQIVNRQFPLLQSSRGSGVFFEDEDYNKLLQFLLNNEFWGSFLRSGDIASLHNNHDVINDQLHQLSTASRTLVAALIHQLCGNNTDAELAAVNVARDHLLEQYRKSYNMKIFKTAEELFPLLQSSRGNGVFFEDAISNQWLHSLLDHGFWGEFLRSGDISLLHNNPVIVKDQLFKLNENLSLLVAALIHQLYGNNTDSELTAVNVARDHLLEQSHQQGNTPILQIVERQFPLLQSSRGNGVFFENEDYNKLLQGVLVQTSDGSSILIRELNEALELMLQQQAYLSQLLDMRDAAERGAECSGDPTDLAETEIVCASMNSNLRVSDI